MGCSPASKASPHYFTIAFELLNVTLPIFLVYMRTMATLSRNFAEYEASAPELAETQATGFAKTEGGLESLPPGANVPISKSIGGKDKKKILGLAPCIAVVLILLVFLVICAIIVGSVVGTRHSSPSGVSSYIISLGTPWM
jgi:Na+-transporting methylmalonyl-CoA/oxaloacetate decarboxylase gamma subunit